MDDENQNTGVVHRVKNFINECARVLRVTKKPDRREFLTTVKVTALGIALIGIIGFLLAITKQLIFG
jgi:protein transport protein SEC61 subunit gamma and related proteins